MLAADESCSLVHPPEQLQIMVIQGARNAHAARVSKFMWGVASFAVAVPHILEPISLPHCSPFCWLGSVSDTICFTFSVALYISLCICPTASAVGTSPSHPIQPIYRCLYVYPLDPLDPLEFILVLDGLMRGSAQSRGTIVLSHAYRCQLTLPIQSRTVFFYHVCPTARTEPDRPLSFPSFRQLACPFSAYSVVISPLPCR